MRKKWLARTAFIAGLSALAGWLIVPPDAQAYFNCVEPTKPYLPQATGVDAYGMTQTQTQVQSYSADVDTYYECMRQAAEAVRAERDQLLKDWAYTVNYYNSLHPQ